jgi:hypothetical protein
MITLSMPSYTFSQDKLGANSPKKKTLYCTPAGASLCSFAMSLLRLIHLCSDMSTNPKDLSSCLLATDPQAGPELRSHHVLEVRRFGLGTILQEETLDNLYHKSSLAPSTSEPSATTHFVYETFRFDKQFGALIGSPALYSGDGRIVSQRIVFNANSKIHEEILSNNGER